jgi:Ribonuclease D
MFCETLSTEALEQLPLAAFSGHTEVIDTLKKAEEAVALLEAEKVLGFDTETKPCFVARPRGAKSQPALLQLSNGHVAYLFRLQDIGVSVRLAELLARPDIVKVGVAVRDDIRGLQSYRKFNPSGFVDLQQMAEEYGVMEKGLKKMTAIVLGFRISKGQQLSNWENTHLTPAQQQYAATDAWVCYEIYRKLQEIRPEKRAGIKQKSYEDYA